MADYESVLQARIKQLEELYLATRQERDKYSEACDWVHATANGNTYGLTVADQLEALRMAASMCTEALGLDAKTQTGEPQQ